MKATLIILILVSIQCCKSQDLLDITILSDKQLSHYHYLKANCTDSISLQISGLLSEGLIVNKIQVDVWEVRPKKINSKSIEITFPNPMKRLTSLSIDYSINGVQKNSTYGLQLVDDIIDISNTVNQETIILKNNCFGEGAIIFENTGTVTRLIVSKGDSVYMKKQFILPEEILLKSSDLADGEYSVLVGNSNLSKIFTLWNYPR